jgi:LacI family transcriptional regulator
VRETQEESFEMMNQETKVIIAAPTFWSAIQIAICDHFKKLFKPEEMALRSITDEAGEQKERLKRALVQAHPTALIALDIRPDSDTIAAYTAASVPIVLIDEEAAGVSAISTDNYVGGHIAGEYLIAKGRKKIAIVTGRTQVKGGYNAEQRLQGFKHALSVGKLSIPTECIIEVLHYSREDGIEVMPKLLDIGVDAVFCAAGDNCALGLLAVAKERGIRIPEDIAIIGFDDLFIASVSTPALTTIRQPLEKIAKAAYKMAVIDRNKILRNPQKVIFNPELVVRKSA